MLTTQPRSPWTVAPSDCVALVLLGLLPDKVDLIVSGVNTAANLGHDLTDSGTVAAVIEGIIWGVPGVAVSLDGAVATDPNCSTMLRSLLPPGSLKTSSATGCW